MTSGTETAPRRRRWLALLPLLVFLGLAALFLTQLLSGRDASTIPSALIGATAPQTALPPVDGIDRPGFDPATFSGEVTLVNVWASWCAPCREEHPLLMQLAQDGRISLAGINYKDSAANAARFLSDLGDPFDAVGSDPNGRAAIEWGVYGVPETFLVGRDGRIAFKHVGPLSPDALRSTLLPEIEKALAAPP
jgi:cytochrome c biogenesis protein CcmG/thiol:disulfide interchange protein DsbE